MRMSDVNLDQVRVVMWEEAPNAEAINAALQDLQNTGNKVFCQEAITNAYYTALVFYTQKMTVEDATRIFKKYTREDR